MNLVEYEIMAEVEEEHWWYRGLRALITMYVERYLDSDAVRILDVGCGTGTNLSLMDGFGTAFGVDLYDEALRLTQSRGIESLVRGDALRLPYADASFDVVLLMDVLYHRDVPEKAAPLREISRVLKPGGIVLLNVPAYPWLMSAHDVAVHTDHRFVRSEIVELIQSADLESVEVTYWNMLLFPIVVLVRMLRKGSEESDLAGYRKSVVTSILEFVLSIERAILRRFTLPFGSSIFAVGRKQS